MYEYAFANPNRTLFIPNPSGAPPSFALRGYGGQAGGICESESAIMNGDEVSRLGVMWDLPLILEVPPYWRG